MSDLAAAPPLRVLVNAVHSKSGGGVTYLRNILPRLAAQGLDLHVAIQADQLPIADEICCGLPRHVLPLRSKLATVAVQEQITVPRLARRIGAGLIFSPANYGPLFGRPTVILLRNAFEVRSLDRRLGKKLYWHGVRLLSRLSFATCRRAIVVSRHAGQSFLREFGLRDDPRLSVIHHGIGPAFRPPREDEPPRDPLRLLAVSDIYVQKNFETLFAALAKLAPSYPGLRLDIAGAERDPAYGARLREMCRGLGLDARVRFLGAVPHAEVAALYRRARVFLFPSLVETFGNPMVEAMASGLPVVCSEASALPEIAGGAALLARPGDADDLARKIARLLDESALWQAQSEAGLARARDFSWDQTAARTARVLREAAG